MLHDGAAGQDGVPRPYGPYMDRLDSLVVQHLEHRLLDPERLPELLAGLIDRNRMQAAKLDARLADLRKVVAEADAKLTRLYAAMESGVADPTDPNLRAGSLS